MISLQRKIFSGVAVYTVDTVIGNLAGIASAAIVFRYLTVAEYGTLALFLSYYGVATSFLDFGLGSMFTSETARARGACDQGMEKLFTWGYAILEAMTGSVLLVIFLVLAQLNARTNSSLWVATGGYVWLTAANNTTLTFFLSRARFSRHVIQSVVRVLSRLLFLVSLPFWWQADHLIIVTWSYVVAEGVSFLVSVIMVLDLVQPLWAIHLPPKASGILWATVKQQGLFVSIIVPVKKVQEQLPIWVLTLLAGEAATGAFAAALGGYALAFAFFRSVETTLFPLVSEYIEREWGRLKDALQRTQKYNLWLAILAVVGGWIVAGPMIHILASDRYANAVPLFRILILVLLVYVFGQAQRPILFALQAQRLLLYSYIVGVVAYAIAMVGGTLVSGTTGAACGVVAAEAVIVGVRYWMIQRLDPDIQSGLRDLFIITSEDRRLWARVIQRLWGVVQRGRKNT